MKKYFDAISGKVFLPPPKKVNEEILISELTFFAHSQCNENVQLIKKFATQTCEEIL